MWFLCLRRKFFFKTRFNSSSSWCSWEFRFFLRLPWAAATSSRVKL